MIVGCPTDPAQDLVEAVTWGADHGFRAVELFVEPPHGLPETVDLKALQQVLQEHKLHVIGHTGYTLPLFSGYTSLRRQAIEEVLAAARWLKPLGCTTVNVHAGAGSSNCERNYTLAYHIEALEELCKQMKPLGLTVMLENTPRVSFEYTKTILDHVPDLGLHLDIGHSHITGETEQYIEDCAKRLVHVHAHDNDGTADQHLPLQSVRAGRGVNWPCILRLLKSVYDGCITLEVFAGDITGYLLDSKQRLERMWDQISEHGSVASHTLEG